MVWPLRVLARPLLGTIVVMLVFAPGLIGAEDVFPSPQAAADQTQQLHDSPGMPILRQAVPVDQDDEIPDWVWGVIGGSAGAALAAAAGYSAWLRRRGRD
jgi:hypothetical protein